MAKRLKRVFDIEVKICEVCGGKVKIIACIENPIVIDQILSHLRLRDHKNQVSEPLTRAPPMIM